jgi:ubiquinone/menaquinone biosynthesis C-methylase UbiE
MINSDKLTNWYNFQAPFYHFWRDRYNSCLVHKMVSIIDNSDPKAVLDAGCGTGLFTIGLASLCQRHSFAGVDRSEGMLAVGRKQARKLGLSNTSFCLGDVEALPFAEMSFDTIIAAGLFCNLNDPARALQEFGRVLNAGGQAVIVEFDRNSMTRATRMFFNIMIMGYKLVSRCFKRFRFAEDWDIKSSTVDEDRLKDTLRGEGYDIRSIGRVEGHLVWHCVKGY